MKRISLHMLLQLKKHMSYQEQYMYIRQLLSEGTIKPLKSSGTNGKKPALLQEYWLTEPKKDYSELEEELKYKILPPITVDYYLSHPKMYEKDRDWVKLLNEYLQQNREKLLYETSYNERSFEIWGREKFLTREQGKTILKRCGLDILFLNIYQTTEPLSYYAHSREIPQQILVLENKDTFFSMRRHLLDGHRTILGADIRTLIYGAGKGILRSFSDFDLCVEPYMRDKRNEILYFGDMDYEGIGIYENLKEMCSKRWEILPFVNAYRSMLEKAEAINLPAMKEGQNRSLKESFFAYFGEADAEEMREILNGGSYIPQEILNISDF